MTDTTPEPDNRDIAARIFHGDDQAGTEPDPTPESSTPPDEAADARQTARSLFRQHD